MSRLLLSPSGLLARRMVATSLQTCVETPAGISAGASARRGQVLCFRGADLDVAAIALGSAVFRDRRLELAGLGNLRPCQRLRYRPLADRPFLPSQGRTELGHRWRGSSGIQRQARRTEQHGRKLAQQPSRLSWFGEDGPFSRPNRSGLVADQGV